MDQRCSGSAEPGRTSKLMFFWEDHKFSVILVSCLVLPVIFIPLWILVFLVFRIRNALGLSHEPTPPDKLTDATGIPGQRFAEPRLKKRKVDQVTFAVGAFFNGFVALVGIMMCVLGWKVIGLASGQPGGGIALLLGYSLFAGGVITTIVGAVGFVRRLGREGR